ncbi:MAG: hypothetical protein Tsb0020_23400 [Haliangiales bacterium]
MRSSLVHLFVLSVLVLPVGCVDIGAHDQDPTAARDQASGDKQPDVVAKASGAISVYVAPVFGPADLTTNDLQLALDFVSQPSLVDDTVWIELGPGLYRNDHSCLTVAQEDWRTDCSPIASRTAFLLAGRRAPTYIYGTTGDPQDVVLWGKVPSDVLGDASRAFHGLTLDDNTSLVEISDLSIASDGGWIGNGIGDASLAVIDSRADLRNTIVLANKSNSNCLFGNTNGDQEGILADGEDTYLRVFDSAVGGNLHTGVMVLNSARVLVQSSLVRGNGWVSQFQSGNKGHGITEFHNASAAACLGSHTELDVDDSQVIYNSGAGVYIRGEFVNNRQDIDHNDITNNHVGLQIDGGSWGGAPSTTTFTNAHVYNTYNRLASNTGGNVAIDYGEIIGSGWYHAWGNSATAPGGDGPVDGSLWNKLLAVKDLLATVPRACTATGPICQ